MVSGVDAPASPTLSDFSCLSLDVSKFLRYRRVHEVGYLESYDRLIPALSHFVWASGYRKGRYIERTRGEAYERVKGFDITRIKPKFKLVPPPPHIDSVYLQSILGDVHVSEYGAFVHNQK